MAVSITDRSVIAVASRPGSQLTGGGGRLVSSSVHGFSRSRVFPFAVFPFTGFSVHGFFIHGFSHSMGLRSRVYPVAVSITDRSVIAVDNSCRRPAGKRAPAPPG